MSDDYAEDLEETAPTEGRLAAVVELARQQVALEDELAEAEATLADVTARLRAVRESALPEAMSLAGMKTFALTSGEKVAIEEKTTANIAKADAPEAFAWLRESGHGDLVKRAIAVAFGRGDDALADELLELIRGSNSLRPLKITDDERVHPQTLGAFVREQLALGAELSPAISVLTFKRAVITRNRADGQDAF